MAPTQTDYIILAYLAESPEHGYKLVERMKQDNVQLVADLSVPNIYHALRRLHRNGAVGQSIRKSRSRPDQKIYSITDKGKEMLSRILQDELLHDQRIHFRYDLVLLLRNRLNIGVPETEASLRRRIDCLAGDLEAVQDALRDSQTSDGPMSGISEIAFRHQIRFLKNEIDFYRKLLKELKAPPAGTRSPRSSYTA